MQYRYKSYTPHIEVVKRAILPRVAYLYLAHHDSPREDDWPDK